MFWNSYFRRQEMIIVHLNGGLGNQMFQYAVGRSLSLTRNVPLKLDVKDTAAAGHLGSSILDMEIVAEMATEYEIALLRPRNVLQKTLNYLSSPSQKKYFKEKVFHFDSTVFDLGATVYLDGYFQSEKYFLSHTNIIRKELTPKYSSISSVSQFLNQLQKENSVSIHIRRGDYLHNKTSNVYHGVLSIEYYKEAILILKSAVTNPVFYFFTDDPNWVRDNFESKEGTLVSGNITSSPMEDLFLMSKCNHNIIANSSFSWWGAWLGGTSNKVVIAPSAWFNDGPKDTEDLIPSNWLKI